MKRALAAVALSAFVSAAAAQSGNNLEIIHHPNYDKNVFMPFSPAIKVKSGKILWRREAPRRARSCGAHQN